jgi:uncharacterized SAM-binding protein YcdF (DUF218 family)
VDFAFFIKNLLAMLILPPVGLLIAGLAGWYLLPRRPRLARWLVGIAVGGLWLLATPMVTKTLIGSLEVPFRPIRGDEADAIVVLGSGVRLEAPEFGGDTVTTRSLERLRYGAFLHRRTGKPILVTGGAPTGNSAEARLMRKVLEEEFRVPVAWMEDRSTNTHENARNSAEILKAAGIRRVFLVSHVWHLPRAQFEFEREGLTVIPAGTDYIYRDWDYLFEYLPAAGALTSVYYASHEWVGRLWALFNG